MGYRIFHSIKTQFDFIQNNEFFSHHIYRLFSFFCSYLFALFFRNGESTKLDEFEESNSDDEIEEQSIISSSNSRYEFLSVKGLCRFIDEPEILSFTIHDSVSVSDSDFFSDAIMDTPIFDTGEKGKHKIGLETEQPVTAAADEAELMQQNVESSLLIVESRSTIGNFYKISVNEDDSGSSDDGIVVAAADEAELIESSLLIVESRSTIGDLEKIRTNEDNSASSDDVIVVAAADEVDLTQQNLESSLLIVKSRDTIGDLEKISTETETDEDNSASSDDGIVVSAADEVNLMQQNLESSLLMVESHNMNRDFDKTSTKIDEKNAVSDVGIGMAAAAEVDFMQQNLECSLLTVESRNMMWDFEKFSINEDNFVSDEEFETEETEDSIDEVSEKSESEIDDFEHDLEINDDSSECSNDVFEEQTDSNPNIISVPEVCLTSLEQSNHKKGEEGTTESSSDDEYIELLPQKLNSILFRDDETFQPDKKTSSQGVSENDEHEDLIQQLKMEIKLARTGGLPTIIEEPELQDSDTPKTVVQHLKPMKIDDQKLDYKHLLESIRKVYGNYSDKMRKLDILNFQTMHSLGLVDIKDKVELQKARKSLVPTITSLVSHNLWLCKGSAVIEPIKKVIVDMQTHFETVYIGQLCLSWEILHWQYSKAQELQNYQSNNHSFNQVAGEFQLFQVLIQRFLEDEQFQGPRIQNYVNNRCVLRALLQVPLLRDDTTSKDKVGKRGNESNEDAITSRMLPSIIEQSMKVFWDFVRNDKGESNIILQSRMHSHSNPEQFADSELLTDVRINFQKKEKKLKDILRSGNCIVKRFKKQKDEDYGMHQSLLIAQVEMKLVAKVLSMSKLTTEKLIWCHEKLDKINVSNRKVFVEPSFLLFPC